MLGFEIVTGRGTLVSGVPAGAVSRDAEGGDRAVTEGSVESFPASDALTY